MISFPGRYEPMFLRTTFLLFLYSLVLSSCQQTKIIEKKNDNGILMERYSIIKEKDIEIKHGLYERFDEQGRIAEQSNYKSGKLEGIRKLYEQGILESEETRVADQFHGPYKGYFPNGQLRMEANYEKDIILGDVKVYYPTGKLKEIVRFADNVETGPFIEYYENGNLKAEGNYKQSDGPVEDGELKLYDSTGTLIRIMDCELGKCITKWTKDTTSLH
jgi:antitoxin component YwqK of YwqJK toxin-antitoxin module